MRAEIFWLVVRLLHVHVGHGGPPVGLDALPVDRVRAVPAVPPRAAVVVVRPSPSPAPRSVVVVLGQRRDSAAAAGSGGGRLGGGVCVRGHGGHAGGGGGRLLAVVLLLEGAAVEGMQVTLAGFVAAISPGWQEM